MAKHFTFEKNQIEFSTYTDNNRTAIIITENHELLAVATINIPEFPIEDDEVIIKDYSENEGVLDDLINFEIISKPIYSLPGNFPGVEFPVCKLLVHTILRNNVQKVEADE